MSRRDKAIDQELDLVTNTLVTLDRRETGLDQRLEAVEGKLRTDQVQTAQDHGLPADLVSVEESVWRRLTPGRARWPGVAEFDDRVADVEQRQAEVHRRIAELGEQLQNAPGHDARELADWELQGRDGARPEPTTPGIKQELEQRQLEWESYSHAVGKILAEKVAYVAKHRKRLEREADEHVERVRQRYLDLVDQLAEARAELYGMRRAAVWVRTYPAEVSTREPVDSFAGGFARPLRAMGVAASVAADRVFDGLRADANYLAEAASPEQRAAIAGIDPRQPPGTIWDNTDEGRQWKNAQRKAALERRQNPQ